MIRLSEVEEIIAFDAEDLEDFDKLTLALISKKKIMRTRLQKSVLVYRETFESGAADYLAYGFGGYSEDVDHAAALLEDIGAVSEDRSGYLITDYGKKIVEHLKKDDLFVKMDEDVDNLTKALSNVSDRELVGLTYQMYPEFTEESTIKNSVDQMNAKMIVDDKPLRDFEKELFKKSIEKGIPLSVKVGR